MTGSSAATRAVSAAAARTWSPERPVLTVGQIGQLAEAIHPRYRALILLAVFGSLRWGELSRCADATSIRPRARFG